MNCTLKNDSTKLAAYDQSISQMDVVFLKIGLPQPALRALVDLNVKQVADLQKVDFLILKKAHGIGPKALQALAQFYI
jgi:hypothetical protein